MLAVVRESDPKRIYYAVPYEGQNVKRHYKARVFELLYSDKKELLKLYNAANKSNYTNPEELKITTLDNAIYIGMKNDISFIIDSRLNLYEHQSTYNPNLPLRFLMYTSDILSGITKRQNIYGKKLIKVPTPHFLIFYNGDEEYPDVMEMKLSSAYEVAEENPALELKVTMLNINPGHNPELLEACKSLADYSEFVSRCRKYTKQMEPKYAVMRAVNECIQEGILTEFLSRNKEQVMKSFLYEYDFEEHMRMEREDAKEEALAELIRKKCAKGKSVIEIAEALEETEETIQRLIVEYEI